MKDVHESAARGFSAQAGAYARGRPEYPDAIVGWLSSALGLGPGRRAVDLGAGTGKFTRRLLETGADVVAVEPVAAMRERLVEQAPGVPALDGTAQSMPLPDASADAVVCAQAFHWFATREALAEIRRVLRPGGVLGLVWNERDESVDWVEALTHIVAPHEGDTPRFRKGTWRAPFDGTLFAMPEETVLAHAHVGGAQEVVVDRFLSVSFIAALPDDERAGVERQLRELIETHPALHGRETISFPYRTRAFRCVRV